MAGIRYKGQIFSGVASVGDADEVSYDNTQSGLAADNVQDALDEVNTRLQNIAIKKAKVYDSNNVSVSTASTDLTFSFPADFHSSLGIVLANSWPSQTWDPSACVSIRRDWTVHGNQAKVTLSSTKTQTYQITLYLLYI